MTGRNGSSSGRRAGVRVWAAAALLGVMLTVAACSPRRLAHAVPGVSSPSEAAEVTSFRVPPGRDADPVEPAPSLAVLSLEQALAMAWERNPDLRAATERVAEAKAHLGEATAAFYPQIGTRLSYMRTDNPSQAFGMLLAQRRFSFAADFNDPGATENWRPEVVGALPLFRGGQDYQRRAAARVGVMAATLERAAVRNMLADAVIAAYYLLLAAPEHVEVTRASIEAVERALAQARARFEAGTTLKSDVLSLEVRLASAREAHVRAQNAVELARAGLRVLLGLSAAATLEVTGGPEAMAADVAADLETALQGARAVRPEIAAARHVVSVRLHELRAERAAYLPRVDVVASYGQDAPHLKWSRRRDNWTVGAAAEIDLFSGFRTTARVQAAERRLTQAREAERKARLEVDREVTAAVLSLQEARARARVTTAAVAASEEALRLVREQYDAGTVIITRYLEAEVARTDARSRAIAARYDARRAEAGLLKAIGHWAGPETR